MFSVIKNCVESVATVATIGVFDGIRRIFNGDFQTGTKETAISALALNISTWNRGHDLVKGAILTGATVMGAKGVNNLLTAQKSPETLQKVRKIVRGAAQLTTGALVTCYSFVSPTITNTAYKALAMGTSLFCAYNGLQMLVKGHYRQGMTFLAGGIAGSAISAHLLTSHQ